MSADTVRNSFFCVAEMSNRLFFFLLSSTSHVVGMSSLAALTDQVWPRSDNRYSNTRYRFMGFITFNNVLQESLLIFFSFCCLFVFGESSGEKMKKRLREAPAAARLTVQALLPKSIRTAAEG